MKKILTKTNYILYLDCAKNAWVKIHKPEIYNQQELSQFEKNIIEAGNEVDKLARSLFPGGTLVENRDDVDYTKSLIDKHVDIIYQPVFETDKYKIASDILVWNDKVKAYDLFEVKASNSGEEKKAKDNLYTYDLAFQYVVLKSLNVPLNKTYIIRLNNEYVRVGDLSIHELFTREDFTEKVLSIVGEVSIDMENAYQIISTDKEPFGSCKCILRGKSAQCTTFKYSNPNVPEYPIHQISNIGKSKAKLEYLVDNDILSIHDVPEDTEGVFELSENQRNQVRSAQTGKITIDYKGIGDFLSTLQYPISFIDYETYAAAIPRFSGYSPFNQITFQFSLHIINDNSKDLIHYEFLFTEKTNPDISFTEAMKKYIPDKGSILVWHKSFEMGRNNELGERNPEYTKYLEDINSRIIDLEEPFKKQMVIHPEFKGKTSIKYVLPALTKTSYKDMNIKEGGSASDTWNKIVTDQYLEEEKSKKIKDLKDYCELDTKAMVDIWEYLKNLIN
jgi:hypothetical protein